MHQNSRPADHASGKHFFRSPPQFRRARFRHATAPSSSRLPRGTLRTRLPPRLSPSHLHHARAVPPNHAARHPRRRGNSLPALSEDCHSHPSPASATARRAFLSCRRKTPSARANRPHTRTSALGARPPPARIGQKSIPASRNTCVCHRILCPTPERRFSSTYSLHHRIFASALNSLPAQSPGLNGKPARQFARRTVFSAAPVRFARARQGGWHQTSDWVPTRSRSLEAPWLDLKNETPSRNQFVPAVSKSSLRPDKISRR